ncbi:MAG: class I SAM-dependent methyltransferase, partial [Clostridium sp.]
MDNVTSHNSKEYDESVRKVIPFYENFHKETISLIKEYMPNCERWLDIGCGTGTLIEKCYEEFKNTKFILVDISESMLEIAKIRLRKESVQFLEPCSSLNIQEHLREKVNIITAIQVNHYLNRNDREIAIRNAYELLNKDGMYITFENIRPSSEEGIELQLKRWKTFQLESGRTINEVNNHISRFDKEYFPITILEHLELLKKIGFRY